MFSGTNLPPSSCLPWQRRSFSTTKPSSLLSLRRGLLFIGGLRFPLLINCSSSSSPDEEEVAPVDNGLDASVWDADLRAPVSSTSNSPDVVDGNYRLSNSPYAAAIADGLDAIFRSPSSTVSTTTVSELKYDVFISFRGPDSGNGFVSHLYDDLCRVGLETFLDREKLVAGEEIEPALSDAIERSRISVVVFTKDYASSTWCLRELARIMVCRRTRGQLVLPVFLGVKPVEVREQIGCYGDAFSNVHKATVGSLFAEEVKRWREALTDTANLAGFDSTAVRPDSILVDTIVTHILKNLESNSLRKDERLVGASHYVKEVEELLEKGSDEVRTIWMFGIGGSGKTAIAGANYPPDNLLKLSMRATAYAKGIPLALKVLGSFLSKRSVPEWESALRRLDSSLDEEIFKILRVSYDGLNDEEKAMFLHLACLFDGEERSHIADLFDGCGLSAEIAISALVDKCMITFTNDRLQMHDLFQKMGRQIVKQESRQDPSKRSRLWSFGAVKEVLTKNTGTISTEGISLHLSKNEDLRMGPRAFAQMHNLIFLRFVNKQSNEESCEVYLPEGLDHLPPKLRLLSWDSFPLKNWPGSFIPENLVELRMHNSRLKRLWEGVESLLKLKGIDLSNSRFLKELPVLSNAPNVERIVARGCSDLVTIPTPRNKLEYLVHLDLSGCSKLKDFPEISWNIKTLCLAESGIEEIPPSIENFHQLVHLDMRRCKMLKNVAQTLQKLEKLEFVDLSGCSRVSSFPDISCNVKKLLLNETSIEEIPSRIKCMRNLVLLELKNCPRLKSLPSSICELKSLVKLNLSGSSEFTNFPEISETMDSLKYLSLSGSAIKELSSSLEKLTALCSLDLENCKSLISLNLSKLKYLEELNISGCSNLVNLLGCNIGSLVNVRASGRRSEVVDYIVLGAGLSSLKTLDLSDCGITEFPEALTLISTLMELNLSQNGFSNIPRSIKDLEHLQSLDLSHCPELQSISGIPARLTRLNVLNCKSLKMVALSNSSELQLYPLNNVETFLFAGCSSLSQYAIDDIEAFAKRRIHVLTFHVGVILNFRCDDLSLNRWMEPQQIQYLLSTMYGYGNLHEALTGLHTAFFSDELILTELPSRLLGRILHDFHERYRLGFAISVLVAFDGYKDDKGINIKYECDFRSKKFGTRVGAEYLRGWDGKKGKPLSIEGDHLFLGFDSSLLLDAANGIEKFVLYSEDLVETTFQCYVVDEDGNPIKSCTVKKCAVQPLYTSDMIKSPKEILSRQDITNGWKTRFSGLLEKVLQNLDLYGAISLSIRNALGCLSVDVVHQRGYVYINIKCENAGLPIGLQILNVHLGIAQLAVKLFDMAEKTQDRRLFSIEFSDVDGGDYGCRIRVKKCKFRQVQSHIMAYKGIKVGGDLTGVCDGIRNICFDTIKIKGSGKFLILINVSVSVHWGVEANLFPIRI
ncbi:hypothetical protein AALP_AA8G121900 [Arabis alpina]|uniref:TIR domain-containing protein n=1 Tax=Arabis alpina TaxID=50452 RepID=A0A087G6J1_ARAAL|nr:hypothetical protein AALP_AA8G121900 [Arabis alpina]